jgi:phage tail protein X
MDVLKDKSYRDDYKATSRYSTTAYYYDESTKKYCYGSMRLLDDNTKYVLHNLQPGDTLDSLAYEYYGRPDFYWIIAEFNHIRDTLQPLLDNYTSLRIPSKSSITWR